MADTDLPTGTPTLADRLNALADQHGGTWDRRPNADGTVTLRLHFAAGTAAGTGADNAAAFASLDRVVAAIVAATGV